MFHESALYGKLPTQQRPNFVKSSGRETNLDASVPDFKITGEANNNSAYRSLTYIDKQFPVRQSTRTATVAMNMDGASAKRYRNKAKKNRKASSVSTAVKELD